MEYITLIRGDDTNALGGLVTITLKSEIDLIGMTAAFRLGDFLQEFTDLTSGELQIVIPAAETAKLPLGPITGTLQLTDTTGRQKTVIRNIFFDVKKGAR